VSKDTTYRSNFTRFYRLRFPRTDCYDHYFDLLERSKHAPELSFVEVLAELQNKTGRIEASFASKLIATVDPSKPVIDRIVLARMGYRLPYHYESESTRMQKVVDLHQQLVSRYEELIQDSRFDELKRRFTTVYQSYEFTDLKMLDLMIWEWGKPVQKVPVCSPQILK
jgi:hypothetical protein